MTTQNPAQAPVLSTEAERVQPGGPLSGEVKRGGAEDAREALAQWMLANSYATGHGDTVEDLLSELDWQHRERTFEPLTPRDLLSALKLGDLPDNHRLIVMCQNPANYHHWSKPVGEFTAGQVRDALRVKS